MQAVSLLIMQIITHVWRKSKFISVTDPDLELKGRPSLDLIALLAFFPSVISSFFTQNKGVGVGADPSPRSTTAFFYLFLKQ